MLPCCATRASTRATASSSTCRWCAEAAFAMLACARHRRRAFRRLRRLCREANSPPASTTHGRSWSSRRHAASSPAASSPTSRCSTARSRCRNTSRNSCLILQRDAARCELAPGPRHRLCRRCRAARGSGREVAMRAGRRDRSALHHLHVRHDRPAQGHRARQWRPHGRAEMVDGERVRRKARRGVLGGIRCRLGGRPFLHRLRRRCCMAAPRSCSRASRSARPTPARSGASSPSMAWWRCSPRRPPSAPSRRTGSARRAFVPKYDLSRFRTLFLAGERADPEPSNGRNSKLGVPVIDHWWQTETGSPMSARTRSGLGMLPVKYGSPGVPMPGYDVRVLDDAGHAGAARHARQRRRQAAAAARLPADALERRRALPRTPISMSSPAITRRPMPASSTRTAICSSWRAPTTSSTSPATACRPAPWKRWWPSIPTSPNARSSASPMR